MYVQECKFVFLGSKDADLRELKSTQDAFEKFKPTHVIHLAAKVGGLFANMNDKVAFYEENMQINMNVIKCSH